MHQRGTETKNENSNVQKTEKQIHLQGSIVLYIWIWVNFIILCAKNNFQ